MKTIIREINNLNEALLFETRLKLAGYKFKKQTICDRRIIFSINMED